MRLKRGRGVALTAAVLIGALFPPSGAGAAMDLPSYLRVVVTKLSREIGVRSYRDPERLGRAGKFIGDELASFGYAVSKQSFTYEGRELHNIVAEHRGEASGPVLIVGAHYDTVQTTPGADDNASGVAGLLGMAKLLAGKTLQRPVRFVAFAFEEPPAYRTKDMGSYHYAQELVNRGTPVDGMICLEMIGYFSEREGSQHYPLPLMKLRFPKAGNFISMVGNRTSRKFTLRMAESFRTATDLPLVTLNAPAFMVGIDFSDHWSFHKFGIPAFMVTDTAFYRNPNYHGSTDLPDTLDYLRMAKVVEGLVAAVEEWGKR